MQHINMEPLSVPSINLKSQSPFLEINLKSKSPTMQICEEESMLKTDNIQTAQNEHPSEMLGHVESYKGRGK